MNMKKTAFAVAAALAASVSFAQEADQPAADQTVPETAVQKKDNTRWFFSLPLCRRVDGGAEVKRPGSSEWAPAEEGRFYPLGTSYRAAKGGTLVIAFGNECLVTVADGASFGTRAQGVGESSRRIVLTGGEVSVSLPGNLRPGMFFVAAPDFTVRNPAGDSKFSFEDKGDGYSASVRCVTGLLEVEGRHFTIPAMHAADAFDIRSSHDGLETILYGRSGDYVVKLDRGTVASNEVLDDGSVKSVVEQSVLDWHLSVATRVQINRAVPAVGERLSVAMMTFDSAGTMQNHFAFAEGRAEVNTGELVVKATEEDDIADRSKEVTNEEVSGEDEGGEAEASQPAGDDANE